MTRKPSGPTRPHARPSPDRHKAHAKPSPKRLFGYDELRLLLLAMIEQSPRHGYEIITAIEERFNGGYRPSPGVIYPCLSWLEEMGYIAVAPDEDALKLARITQEGEGFVAANRAAADALLTRTLPVDHRASAPEEIVTAMDDIKLALRRRLAACDHDPAVIEALTDTLRRTAQEISGNIK